jgi:hypothetical protein
LPCKSLAKVKCQIRIPVWSGSVQLGCQNRFAVLHIHQ